MAKRKRNIQILFCVSPEEKKLIRRKMIESKTKNMGAYLRKMAIDGSLQRDYSYFVQPYSVRSPADCRSCGYHCWRRPWI